MSRTKHSKWVNGKWPAATKYICKRRWRARSRQAMREQAYDRLLNRWMPFGYP